MNFSSTSYTLFPAIMLHHLKLMNQAWENFKKTNFGPHFGLFGPHLGPQKVFHGFYIY